MKNMSVLPIVALLILMLSGGSFAAQAPVLQEPVLNGMSVSLKWNAVENAQEYTLYYAPMPYTGPESIGNIPLGNRTEFSAELWQGAAFYVAITATDTDGESQFSNICQFTITGATAPFDDFSGTRLDKNKWRNAYWYGLGREQVLEVSGGQLIVKVSGISDDHGHLGQSLRFTNPAGISSMAADVTYVEGEIDPDYSETTWVTGGELGGEFYKDTGGETVWASIALYSVGNQLVVTGQMEDSIGFHQTEPFSTSFQAGVAYRLKISYDGDHTFSFSVGDESKTLEGVPPGNTPLSDDEQERELATFITSKPDIDMVSRVVGGYISMRFDNIDVNDAPYEDFSGTTSDALSPGKWLDSQIVREIRHGKLAMDVETGSNDWKNMAYLQQGNDTDYFQAEVVISSDSVFIGDNLEGAVKLYGTYYNTKHDGSGYEYDDGEVYPGVTVKRYPDGSLKVYASIFQCDNARCSEYTTLLDNKFLSCTPQLDKPVIVALEHQGNTMIFTCDGASYSHTLTGPLYPSAWKLRKLRSRVYQTDQSEAYGYGYMKVTVDNVYTQKPE